MQIVGLVNGNSNNADFQFQTAASSLLNQGTIAGLAVTTNQVGVGSALISVTSNGQTWLITYHNTSVVTIDTSGTKKVWIDVTQSKIDNGVANNEDGTGIAQVNTGASYPVSGSYIPLASITSGIITDDRVFISMKNVKRKAMTANRLIYIDASGNEQELAYGTSGQVLTAVNATTTPIWASPSVDISSLTQKANPIGADKLIISDSEASGVNKSATVDSIIGDGAMFGDGSDGDLTISSGTTTIPFSASGYVEKNYNNLTITGGTLTFSSPSSNGSVAYIKVKGRFKMTGGTISVVGMGAAGGTIGYTILRGNGPGAGVAGNTGTAGTGYQDAGWTTIFNGSGGGASPSAFGGSPGRGGGILIIEADEWEFTTGIIDGSGQNGVDGTAPSQNQGCAGGGGGGAGTIVRRARIIVSDTGTYKVDGGNGANGLKGPNGNTGNNDKGGGGGGSYANGGIGGTTPANGSNSTWGTGGVKGANQTDGFGNVVTGGGGGGAGRVIKN